MGQARQALSEALLAPPPVLARGGPHPVSGPVVWCTYQGMRALEFLMKLDWCLAQARVLFGEGNGSPLQYSCLENPINGEVWWAAVYGVAKSRTRLSDFTFTFHFHALQKEMATHSSVLAWRIPGTVEPGGLLPMGSHRVGHD